MPEKKRILFVDDEPAQRIHAITNEQCAVSITDPRVSAQFGSDQSQTGKATRLWWFPHVGKRHASRVADQDAGHVASAVEQHSHGSSGLPGKLTELSRQIDTDQSLPVGPTGREFLQRLGLARGQSA